MKILYITNIEVPYRVEFFNQLNEKCDLTVLYERKKSSNRNDKWAKSNNKKFKNYYLNGINVKNEYSFSFKIIRYILNKKYDVIIFGCYNSPVQSFGILLCKLLSKKYYINFDGECFFNVKKIKYKMIFKLLNNATGYLSAGEKFSEKLKLYGLKNVQTYYFSSISNRNIPEYNVYYRQKNFLIVAQFLKVKGIEIVLEVAKNMPDCVFKLVGSGKKSEELLKLVNELNINNVEIIPFLEKKDLEIEFKSCSALIVPSIKECWGLVVNEAACFGTPIIGTNGSGAIIEFLDGQYDSLIANCNDSNSLQKCIETFMNMSQKDMDLYSKYLYNKAKDYTIERSVDKTLKLLKGEKYD